MSKPTAIRVAIGEYTAIGRQRPKDRPAVLHNLQETLERAIEEEFAIPGEVQVMVGGTGWTTAGGRGCEVTLFHDDDVFRLPVIPFRHEEDEAKVRDIVSRVIGQPVSQLA